MTLAGGDELEGLAGQASVVAYTRTGSRYGDFTVRVVAGGKDLCQPFKLGQSAAGFQNATGLDPAQGLYLALGSRLAGLHRPDQQEPNPNRPRNAGNGERKSAVALLARVNELPAVWFGYNSADVVAPCPSSPPVTSTFPFPSKVAVWRLRPVAIPPVAAKSPVFGSYNSLVSPASGVLPLPATTRTLPLSSSVAELSSTLKP